MKRGAVILLVVLGLGAAMGLLSYCFFRDRVSPADWLRKELSLNEEQSARIIALTRNTGQSARRCALALRRLTRDWPG